MNYNTETNKYTSLDDVDWDIEDMIEVIDNMSNINIDECTDECTDEYTNEYIGDKCLFFDKCKCYTYINHLDKQYDHANTQYTLGIHRDDVCESCKWQLGNIYRVVVKDIPTSCDICMNSFKKLNKFNDCNHLVCDNCHYNMTKLPDRVWEEWQYCLDTGNIMTEDHVDITCSKCFTGCTKHPKSY